MRAMSPGLTRRHARAIAIALLALAAIAALACREPQSEGAATTAGPRAAAAEGICPQHGLLESVCTGCDPGLAVVFRAKGDWCAEHEVPESFCPVCHPELGGRPRDIGDLSADEPPPDGLLVRLKGPDAEAKAGLQWVITDAAPSEDVIVAVARIEADPRHRAEIAARAEGVVTRVLAEVGDTVTAGAPLAILEGAAGESLRARRDAAQARLVRTTADRDREAGLVDRGVSPAKDLLAAEEAVVGARADLASATAELALVGGAGLRLVSPLAGVVTRRAAVAGQLVHAGDPLFEVVDLTHLDAVADVREELVSSLRTGREAEVLVDAAPGVTFRAVVEAIAPTIDPLTRTGRVRLHVEDSRGLLRPGMAGRARLASAGRTDAVLVPRDAVQAARGVTLAFVRKSQGVYETRRVTLGATRGDRVEVVAGLSPGEHVATTGSFLLKTETLPGSIGTGCCEIEAPK